MTKTHNKKDKLLKQYFSNISLSLIRSRTEIKCNSYLWSICIKFLNHCHHQKYTNRQFKMAFTWKPVVLWHCGLISYFSLENLQPFLKILPHKLQEKFVTFSGKTKMTSRLFWIVREAIDWRVLLPVASGGSNVSVGVEI